MSDYLYFCKNCRTLETDSKDNRPFRCEECGGKYQPLHVTVQEWNNSSREEKNSIVKKAVRNEVNHNYPSPRGQENRTNSAIVGNGKDSQEGFTDKIKSFIDKISVGRKGKCSKLSVVGFILSFLWFFSVFGLAAGIIDVLKRDGRKKGLSIAAICISALILISSMASLGSSSDEKNADAETVAEEMADTTNQETMSNDISRLSANDEFVDSTDSAVASNNVDSEKNMPESLPEEPLDNPSQGIETTESVEQLNTSRTLYATSKVNIREQPNTDCAILGKAEEGQEVTELEAGSDGWSRVTCGGVEGYIKSEYLANEKNGNTQTVGDATPSNADQEIPVNIGDTQQASNVSSQGAALPGNAGGNGDNFNLYNNIDQQQTTNSWVLNTNTKKIHYPSCKSVPKISPENYATSNSSVSELAAQGYEPCGNCNPR